MIKNAFWLFILSVLVLFVLLPSYTRMQDLEEKNHRYQEEIIALKRKNSDLKEEHRLLVEDPEYLEKVGREKMGLIREKEVVYQITPARQ